MSTEHASGTRLAGYTLERVVGRGAMGVVYLARQHSPERPVALKLVNPAFDDDQQFRRRFLRESAAAVAIDHPHILPVYDAGESDGVLFIAMRFVEGQDLRALLAAGPLEPARALAIVRQIGGALDAAHGRGLVHRDVKPGNILVVSDPGSDEPDFCYLTDFGVSMWTTSSAATMTATGQMVGSLHYAAPEQIEGRRVDGAADRYSLGCVAYECLTGRPPFGGRAPAAVLYAHLHEQPPPASSIRPELPAGVDAVLARALAKEPEERYPSCRELTAALSDAVEGVSARTGTIRAPSRVPRREPRRGPARLAAVAVALGVALAAVVVAVVLVTRAGEPGPVDRPRTSAPPVPLVRNGIQVTASSTAPSSVDGAGNVTTFVPGNVVDGSLDTAWRTPGDGAGERLTLVFDNPIDVARIGLIPGYAKSDPATGVNRFEQNRKVTQVRYLVPGLEPVTQTFRPSAVPQFVRLDATTGRITIEIVETTEPGGGPRFDFTAISEVYVYGYMQ